MSIQPRAKPYKVGDTQGLYLLVNPVGSKLWRVKYRGHGVERKLALGAYPNMLKRQARIDASVRAGNSFASIAEELIDKKARGTGSANLG